MNKQRMIDRGIIFTDMKPAKLYDYELIFNKVSKQGVVANIVYKKDSVVEGILYDVDSLDLLDKYEGVNSGHYKRIILKIDNDDSYVYVCDNQIHIKEGLNPNQEYLNHLLEGKEYLSVEYYEKLKNIL
ncbi:gamma-glutamylcyclotransferase [bacterium]|nr:gamma-glutamylcyclotransferase [bacterium]